MARKRAPLLVAAPTTAPVAPRTSFDAQTLGHVFEPAPKLGVWSWDLERIRAARSEHCRGKFSLSAHLADAMLDDGAIYATLAQRISPAVGLPLDVLGSSYYGGRGLAETARAEAVELFARGSALPPGTIADTVQTLAMMGPFVGQNHWTTRADGSRVDVSMRPWPMHAIEWDETALRYAALTRDGRVPIEPNDGKWVVIAPHESHPWRHGAVRPLGLAWADRSYGVRDRSMLSETQGQPHMLGTLPDGWTYDSAEGRAFIEQMKGLLRARSGMAKPFGSTVEYLEISGAIFQIFENIIKHEESIVAKVLLGQDGTSENSGGNYVKARLLFNVRNDLVEQDLGAMEAGLNAGVLYPWTVVNFGDGRLAPRLKWRMPDLAEDERREALAKRRIAFNLDLKGYRENGLLVDQALVDALAHDYGIEPAPRLVAMADTPAARLDLAPTDMARVVRVDEVRVSQGLPAIGDARGALMLSELDAYVPSVPPPEPAVVSQPTP